MYLFYCDRVTRRCKMFIITDKITTLKYFQVSFTIFLNSVKALLILTMDSEQPKTDEIYEFDKQ